MHVCLLANLECQRTQLLFIARLDIFFSKFLAYVYSPSGLSHAILLLTQHGSMGHAADLLQPKTLLAPLLLTQPEIAATLFTEKNARG